MYKNKTIERGKIKFARKVEKKIGYRSNANRKYGRYGSIRVLSCKDTLGVASAIVRGVSRVFQTKSVSLNTRLMYNQYKAIAARKLRQAGFKFSNLIIREKNIFLGYRNKSYMTVFYFELKGKERNFEAIVDFSVFLKNREVCKKVINKNNGVKCYSVQLSCYCCDDEIYCKNEEELMDLLKRASRGEKVRDALGYIVSGVDEDAFFTEVDAF